MTLCDFSAADRRCPQCGFIGPTHDARKLCGYQESKESDSADAPAPQHGPGTELKKLLAGWPFRIVATANCSCNAKAAEMDRRGIEWCEANVDEIVGWLREEATRRGLPFFGAAGRMLVRRAIAKARKASTAA